ncbi:hypothetical protein OHT61_31755 [Streptomyces sp. NBC_00178]|uniref:hypothetical protein n=1 Tax=Streptomyces sp. NBC_00178 TaxID=2975672 RepID=UPI002E281338|nr:hypothetical protein [Streptomyces sp. NBC_00178]
MEKPQVRAMPTERIRYRYTSLQHLLAVLPLLLVWSTEAWDWITSNASGSEMTTSLSTWFALVLVMLIAWHYFGVTLTASKAVVHNVRHRTIQWPDVQAIRVENFQGNHIVVIYEADGRRTRLRTPTTGFLSWDPKFDEKFSTIDQWWQQHRGPDWTPGLLAEASTGSPPIPAATTDTPARHR